MKLKASANKRSSGYHRSGASGTVHFVRIEQRLARFASDAAVLKRAALAQAIVDGARLATASKSASDVSGIQAEKRLALNAWEDEGGAVRGVEGKTKTDGPVKLICPS